MNVSTTSRQWATNLICSHVFWCLTKLSISLSLCPAAFRLTPKRTRAAREAGFVRPRWAGHLACGGFPLAARFTGWGHHEESHPRPPSVEDAAVMQTDTCLYVYQMSYIAFFVCLFVFFTTVNCDRNHFVWYLTWNHSEAFFDVWEELWEGAGDFSSLQGRMAINWEWWWCFPEVQTWRPNSVDVCMYFVCSRRVCVRVFVRACVRACELKTAICIV